MAMTGSDPSRSTYPRMFWLSSPDLKTWSDVVWGEPYGIDPHLFKDPISGKTYLTVMGLNNGYDRLWGISQCQIDLKTGKCLGPYRNIWNGTMPVTTSTRPEGPKLFHKDDYYYLLIAEGGTGVTHRASIGRSDSPEGPWESSPTNPLIYNGADLNLTISCTGHATFADTPDGRWFSTLLGRRNVDDWAVLGRETFFTSVQWEDGWPMMNNGEFLKLSQSFDYGPDQEELLEPFEDHFDGSELDLSWYQLRSPYTENFYLRTASSHKSRRGPDGFSSNGTGVVFVPNVYTLSDRDTPAAILRKQRSVNMTFAATLLPTDKGLGPYQSVGLSAYSTEMAHQDMGVRGCANSTGLCVFVDMTVASPGPGTAPKVCGVTRLCVKELTKSLLDNGVCTQRHEDCIRLHALHPCRTTKLQTGIRNCQRDHDLGQRLHPLCPPRRIRWSHVRPLRKRKQPPVAIRRARGGLQQGAGGLLRGGIRRLQERAGHLGGEKGTYSDR